MRRRIPPLRRVYRDVAEAEKRIRTAPPGRKREMRKAHQNVVTECLKRELEGRP